MLWAIMADVAHSHDCFERCSWNKQPRSLSAEQYSAACVRFFKTLAFLLPCKYCRISYQGFISQTDSELEDYAHRKKLLEWVWIIHTKVNTKLEKPNLTLKHFYQRTFSQSFFASGTTLFDFLFILAVNYDPQNHPLKAKYTKLMHDLLPFVMPYPFIAQTFGKKGMPTTALQSSGAYSLWLFDHVGVYAFKSKTEKYLKPLDEYVRQALNSKA